MEHLALRELPNCKHSKHRHQTGKQIDAYPKKQNAFFKIGRRNLNKSYVPQFALARNSSYRYIRIRIIRNIRIILCVSPCPYIRIVIISPVHSYSQ
jgi:hypothetical protein